jgi:hypothetical protein
MIFVSWPLSQSGGEFEPFGGNAPHYLGFSRQPRRDPAPCPGLSCRSSDRISGPLDVAESGVSATPCRQGRSRAAGTSTAAYAECRSLPTESIASPDAALPGLVDDEGVEQLTGRSAGRPRATRRRSQLAIIEVKKEGNPDTGRVVAQLLDSAATIGGWRVNPSGSSSPAPRCRLTRVLFARGRLGASGAPTNVEGSFNGVCKMSSPPRVRGDGVVAAGRGRGCRLVGPTDTQRSRWRADGSLVPVGERVHGRRAPGRRRLLCAVS